MSSYEIVIIELKIEIIRLFTQRRHVKGLMSSNLSLDMFYTLMLIEGTYEEFKYKFLDHQIFFCNDDEGRNIFKKYFFLLRS